MGSTDELVEGDDPAVEVGARVGDELVRDGGEIGVDPDVHLVRRHVPTPWKCRQPCSCSPLPFLLLLVLGLGLL